MRKTLISIALLLSLTACGDGVIVAPDNAGGSSTNGNSSGSTTGSSSTGTTGTNTGTNTGSSTGTNQSGTTGDTSGSSTGNTDNGSLPDTTASTNLDSNDVAAARFLNRASFGATEESIAQFRQFSSASDWIDAQFELPVSTTSAYTQANSNGSSVLARHEVWWNNVLDQPDQLRQRVAFALSQIFVVSDLDYALANGQYGMSDYYDMLSRNAFGNYRKLLEDVTLHPVMGVYLSMARNEKANAALKIRPDENYAREVLQLFSIGLNELNIRGEALPANNPQPAYSQNIVEEFARVFTGWDFPATRYWGDTNVVDAFYIGRMQADEQFHDNGSKSLLNGAVVPAGLSAEQDMQAALDNIFQHANVAPFISKQLIQRLVTSSPTPEYVERVATVFNNNGNGVKGDLKAVIKTILLDDEAMNGHNIAGFGKIREPNIKLAHYWRALKGVPGPEADGVHNTADFPLNELDEMGGQAVMKSKSVFNFFQPGHTLTPNTDQLAPEMQIMTESFLATTSNNYHHLVYRFHNRADLNDDNPAVTITNLEPLADLSANPDNLLDWYNLIFFAGSMPDDMRAAIRAHMLTLPNTGDGRFARAQDSLFMVMVSPASNIQR